MDSRLRGNDEQDPSQPHINNTQKPAVKPNEAQASQQQPVIPAKAGIHQDIAFIDALKVGEKASLAEVLTAPRNITTQSSLSDDGWRLEDKNIAKLRTKLMRTGKPLKEACGSPLYGIKTGFNEAFVIDGKTKDKLIAQDGKSAELLKPFLEGKGLKPWHVEPRDLWLIRIAKGWTREQSGHEDETQAWAWLQQHYPAICQWLEPFSEKAKKRGDKGEFWWELRACAYYDAFEEAKLYYADISDKPNFSLDEESYYAANTCYFIPNASHFLAGLMQSNITWFLYTGMAPSVRGGFYRFFSQYVETLPIPKASKAEQQAIADIAAEIQGLAEARFQVEADFRHRIACDLGESPDAKLNKKLHDWFMLDGVQFRKEIKKAFKTDIPLAERSDWEAHLQSQAQKVAGLNVQIHDKETELNQMVYALFQLTKQEILLLESC